MTATNNPISRNGASTQLLLLVEEDASLRRSLQLLLQGQGFEVRAHASAAQALADDSAVRSNVLVADSRLLDSEGIDVLRSLHELGWSGRAVLITGFGSEELADMVDFRKRPPEQAMLLGAIEATLRQPGPAGDPAAPKRVATDQIAVLTPRERDVLRGLAHGRSNKTIAYDLGISPRTVEVHRANAMAKLHVHSFSEALRVAFAAGLDGEL